MATETVQIKASGMMCSFCTMSVEKALKRLPGVNSVLVNLVHGVVLVEADTSKTSKKTLADSVNALGYPVSETRQQQLAKDQAFYKMVRWRGLLGLALAAACVLVDPVNLFGLPARVRGVFSLALALFVLIWVGKPVLIRTLAAVRKAVINANVLLSTAAWGSLVVGALSLVDPRWPNFLPVATWLMALHIFSNYFKLGTNLKAAEAVRGLLSLQPPRARVLRGGAEVDVDVKQVSKGETVLVRPGERIPLDGEVGRGLASVDESSFTGESVPVAKEPGNAVIGGTLNVDGALEIVVTKVGEDSFLSQLVRLMSQVSDRKVPLELLADRLMNYYGPVVLVLGGLAFAGWGIATHELVTAATIALATVIMGYPCALGMTTPMLAAIAGGKGITIGLLVKSGEVFHQLSRVDTVVFDKTGTLTYGRPTVTEVVPLGVSEEDLLRWAASVEVKSEHPLGRAIAFFAEAKGIAPREVSEFRSTAGQGVTGNVDGTKLLIGNTRFLSQSGVEIPVEAKQAMDELSAAGKTTVLVAREGNVIGVVALQDTPRPGTTELISDLRDLKREGYSTLLFTGDSEPVARSIAKTIGVDEVRAHLLPADKVSEIEKLQKAGRRVVMVGDGINDGPALLQSDVGIAVGAGTDVAIESAGVILLGDRIRDIAGALVLGKASYRTMQVNVGLAVVANVIGIALAAAGLITPVFAIAFILTSIFAILGNTLRIRAIKLRSEAAPEIEKAALAETEFAVPAMVCDGCAEKITDALKDIPGVREIKSKVAQKHVVVRYEPARVGRDDLKGALDKAGYKAVEA
ncbi:MAG: heavy metal translocating P-type ATPase [Candidatus Rokubacteria bacterium]|nr:heavy metal translocating P-type ATPase [Candidatus Rokubacteria bacterium]